VPLLWAVRAVAVVAIALPCLGAGAVSPPAAAATTLAGSAGTDTALPPTDSAVTVSGRPCPPDMAPDGCGFQHLRITVNQTTNLLNQAISITWTGGAPAQTQLSGFAGDFLQIFQCWGDDDGTNPANPGPPPEKCQFGGFASNPKSIGSFNIASQFVGTRIMSSSTWSTYTLPGGYQDAAQGLSWRPFEAVDGTTVDRGNNYNANDPYLQGQGGYWLNPYFNSYTTNEEPVALSHTASCPATNPTCGTGSELFTVQTGLEAPGLGCGQKIEKLPDGSTRVPKCWLVIVPRGTGGQENVPERRNPVAPLETSPLSVSAWRNRIAIPLEFKPVDTSCPIGADERRIAGSELVTPAVSSWQPQLCATPASPPYNFTSLSEDLARQQLVSQAPGSAGMTVISRPVQPAALDPSNPVVYAPLSLSGVTIGFNIERLPATDQTTGHALDPAELQYAGIRVATINLTPRLVAKLLSESYQYQFGGHFPSYAWFKTNPLNLFTDPDFVQYNPEFQNLRAGSVDAGSLLVEQPTGDAAYEVWTWVLTDPEAATWLSGTPDHWGMKVNPVYDTDPAKNPSGVGFGSPVPDSYPKSDPFCYQSNAVLQSANNELPRPLCLLDMSPYVGGMDTAAAATRAANDGAKSALDTNATSPDTAWVAGGPTAPGLRSTLSVTDTASAARFGLQTAHLSRAGDDATTRTFVAPDAPGILAGEHAMVPSGVPGVLRTDPSTKVAGAYPLAMLTYAAVTPRTQAADARNDYAAFIGYATGPGQTPGLQFGQLPPGYAPLPADLQAQAKAAAATIRAGLPPAPGPTTTTVPPSTPKATGGGAGAGSGARAGAPGASSPGSSSPAEPAAPAGSSARGLPTTTSRPGPGPTGQPTAVAVITQRQSAGVVRWVLPIALGVGLVALVGVLMMDDRHLRATPEGSSKSLMAGLRASSAALWAQLHSRFGSSRNS
jgi:hypothetical protein